MIPLSEYAKAYNNICIYYFGDSINFINSLIDSQKIYKENFPDIKVFICCKDELFETFENKENMICRSDLIKSKNKFAYIREVNPNFNNIV